MRSTLNSKIITFPFPDNFLDRLMEYLDANYLRSGKDLSKLAIVFGGKRPALFLKKALGRKLGKDFYPPKFFTIDDFISETVRRAEEFSGTQDLDQCYLLYNLAKKAAPTILKGRETFSQFLPWSREILSFIDQLDLEDVQDKSLKNIQANARIGYAVPDDINRLLQSIIRVRSAYHEHMTENRSYSRGFQYRRAAAVVDKVGYEEFDEILFCNFFYFNRTEEKVVKSLYTRGKAVLFFQGDERRWPVFERAAKTFGSPIREGAQPQTPKFDLKLYSGFDTHSQVGMVREILKGIKDLARTVVVLPDPHHIIPLLAEITSVVTDFNISMGYPLKRSSLYSLFEFVFNAQRSRTGNGYYTRDYLKVLRHPLVKNLNLAKEASVTRVLVHKIEEALTTEDASPLAGCLFIKLKDVEDLAEIYDDTLKTLEAMGTEVSRADLKAVLKDIHFCVFSRWENITTFASFSAALEEFLLTFLQKSPLDRYPLNLKIADRIMDLKEELAAVAFGGEEFPPEDIFKIFEAKIEREIVAFKGSPLKGMQVLGLFETRSLNFDNVIVLDVNEGALPKLNIYEPLIPREVMISLNLDRLEQEEEIQRYQFMRLISAAKHVHLVYQESKDREKSRFVEELVWEREKAAGDLKVVEVARSSFAVKVEARPHEVQKSAEMIKFLKNHRYSASSINTYLRNPMEFYYNYVLALREKEDLLEEPENRQVGTFVHELLEDVFTPFIGKKPKIDAKFRKLFKKKLDERFAATLGRSMKADAFLLKRVLDARLERFLENEADSEERKVKEILFVEKRFEDKIKLSCGEINFVYKLDRVDRMEDGSVLILDYKTGAVDPMPKGIERIENMDLSRESIFETVKSFQIPLYFHYLNKYFKGDEVNAAFYNLRTLEVKKFIDRKMSYDRERINKAFLRALDFVMNEILDPNTPFIEGEVFE